MAATENQLVEQLKDVGNRLLQPPSSTAELLNLLDEVELHLSKVGQSPSEDLQEALFLPMKALIGDELLRNSDTDIKTVVTACMNEIMRISAPLAPYDDEMMTEIFKLIVSSFDKLSCPSGHDYSKAVSILENVARLQSYVMMLDLDCDLLIVKMFELFLKNISSDHPHSVFLAMKTIMSVIIKESDDVSLELLKVLLGSIRQENQNVSAASRELGAKVIEECLEKLKPFIKETVISMGCSLEDYAPILSLTCSDEPDIANNILDDSAKYAVSNEPTAERDSGECTTAIECCTQNAIAQSGDFKALDDQRTDPGTGASRRGRKPNSENHDEGSESRISKGKASNGSPRGRRKRRSIASKSEEKGIPALEDVVLKKETEDAADLEPKELHQVTSSDDSSKKRGRLPKKDVSGKRGNKSAGGPFRKDKAQINDALRSRRKRASLDDDVIETPHGRKSYNDDLVGCKIKVWWPLDRRYYSGTISSFDASTKKHKVDYDDGDHETLNLKRQRWELIGHNEGIQQRTRPQQRDWGNARI